MSALRTNCELKLIGTAKKEANWMVKITWISWLLPWLRRLRPSWTLGSHLVLNCFSLLHLVKKTIHPRFQNRFCRVEKEV